MVNKSTRRYLNDDMKGIIRKANKVHRLYRNVSVDYACAYFYQLYAKVRSSFATLKVDALPTKFLLRSARL